MPYGMEHPAAAVDAGDAARILDLAWRRGVDMLDTAVAYGEAESVVGRTRPPGSRFLIASKTPPLREHSISAAHLDAVRGALRASLAKLSMDALDMLLVHHAPDLLVPGGASLFRLLESMRDEGLVRRLGVSIYDAPTLHAVLDAYPIDLVQLPLNLLDQRLLRDGTLDILRSRRIEVHARSVFLQGVLLSDPARLPGRFAPVRPLLERLRTECAAARVSPAAAALAFVASCPGVARAVIGVNTPEQLLQNLEAFEAALGLGALSGAAGYAVDDPSVIDPRTWPQ